MEASNSTASRQHELAANLAKVQLRIQQACHDADRDIKQVHLLAVSKTKPVEDVLAIHALGQNAFGENYLQEALQKISIAPDLEWHFIGPIQSNKTRPIAENFSWVHSVDRLKIAQRLSAQRPEQLPPLKILLEVNIDQEDTKSGFSESELETIVAEVITLPNIELRGLMAIPSVRQDFTEQKAVFARMQDALKSLQAKFPQARLDTLSMGMSGDLEAAIFEGATWVRIGTDLFGARNYHK